MACLKMEISRAKLKRNEFNPDTIILFDDPGIAQQIENEIIEIAAKLLYHMLDDKEKTEDSLPIH